MIPFHIKTAQCLLELLSPAPRFASSVSEKWKVHFSSRLWETRVTRAHIKDGSYPIITKNVKLFHEVRNDDILNQTHVKMRPSYSTLSYSMYANVWGVKFVVYCIWIIVLYRVELWHPIDYGVSMAIYLFWTNTMALIYKTKVLQKNLHAVVSTQNVTFINMDVSSG